MFTCSGATDDPFADDSLPTQPLDLSLFPTDSNFEDGLTSTMVLVFGDDPFGFGGVACDCFIVVLATVESFTQEAADDDGVDAAVEDGAPDPDGDVPLLAGDGNGDGTPDSEQPNVTSLPNKVDDQYVTLESPTGTELADVSAIDPATLPGAPAAVLALPYGVTSFKVVCDSGTVVVRVYVPDPVPNAYYKYDPNRGVWQDYSGNVVFVAGPPGYMDVSPWDNGSGDHDGAVNGSIVDPGGGALAVTSKDDCKRGGWADFGDRFKNPGDCVSFFEHLP